MELLKWEIQPIFSPLRAVSTTKAACTPPAYPRKWNLVLKQPRTPWWGTESAICPIFSLLRDVMLNTTSGKDMIFLNKLQQLPSSRDLKVSRGMRSIKLPKHSNLKLTIKTTKIMTINRNRDRDLGSIIFTPSTSQVVISLLGEGQQIHHRG